MNHGKFRVKTELEQHIWSECTRFLANCIIFYNAFILSALLVHNENLGRQEEADIIKGVSPVAWRYVIFLGKFEFQKQKNPLNIDEIISSLLQKSGWHELQPAEY